LGKISEQEKIEIIQTGFQRQAEGKISLKKYYEGTEYIAYFNSKDTQSNMKLLDARNYIKP
jgi:hypothetical protein